MSPATSNGASPELTRSGAAPLVSLRQVSKDYGPVRALDSVTIDLLPGEVHCVAGENGAGKSTLIKVLTGAVPRTAGEYVVGGADVPVQISPTQMRDRGIGVVYQELSLFPELSVLDNLLMGSYSSVGGYLRGTRNRETAREHLRRVGLQDLSLHALVSDLPTATRQLVEIARVLGHEADLVIFDEPTTALSEHEAGDLLIRIAQLRDQGIGILYVTHRIEEMFEIGDRVSVMRDGRLVETNPMSHYTPESLVEAMVGRSLEDLYPGERAQPGEPVLELDELGVGGYTRPVSLTVRTGEIVGIAGLLGSGRSEILRAAFGADPSSGGRVRVAGKNANISRPGAAAASGLGMLTEDRKESGIFPDLSIRENITVAGYRGIGRAGWLSTRRIDQYVEKALRGLRVKYNSLDDPITSLSGGNQQKVLIARWMGLGARALLLDEPTKGVDVGAKADIYAAITEMAAGGMGFLVVSSYLPELIGLCDRILVVKDHAIVADLPAAEATEESIMQLASIDTAHAFAPEDLTSSITAISGTEADDGR
ncbi:sugar ABC transporter ATP-binding protein [Leifsonia sp. AG29]|uniref:sugar ABC transporter ATP-binding protein n=1 Tax=Leifsonia sp. AG29 TaxID=2598860 RepID=UPI00131ADB5D|nr:sugar ABC transporter ATP-binding protein [Leifsonia sp. AG29]